MVREARTMAQESNPGFLDFRVKTFHLVYFCLQVKLLIFTL